MGLTSTSFGQKSGNKGGKGPPKGSGGRPLAIYQKRMQLAAQAAQVEKILKDPDHPQFMKALEFAANRGFGKVAETIEHTGADGGPIAMTVRFVAGG